MAKQPQNTLPLSDLLPDPANIRQHPERNQQAIRASLTRFGPARSIVIDGKNIVRAGNGTLEQAQAAGIDEVIVVEPKPNQLVAVRRSDWSTSEAVGYSIADNRGTDLSVNDETALAETLRALQSEDFDLVALGYDPDELDRLCESLGDGILGPEADGREYDESVENEVEFIECPECHHRWPK